MSLKTPHVISKSVTRRTVLKGTGAAAALTGLPALGYAQAGVTRSHGLSAFGELALPADYTHFPHVNLDAPKGGRLSYQPGTRLANQNFRTFNTLNGFAPRGDGALRVGLTFDGLMTSTGDEVDSFYGALAEWVEYTDDGLQYDFKIRPEARFHDGTPVTADDVAFSLDIIRTEGHQTLRPGLEPMESAEAIEDDMLRVRFRPDRSRTAHLSVLGIPTFSRAFWDGRTFDDSILEPILGSGPYRVGAFEVGRFIEYERDPDYWAADLPFSRGLNNFDTIRVNYYRDRDVAFEAFKAGEMNVRRETVSRIWATGYDFPRVQSGEVLQSEIDNEAPTGAQGAYFNTRREKFQDPRLRHAVGLAFDFEWTNDRIFYGLYQRTTSTFQNAPYMASGLPTPEELVHLEPLRGQIPDAAFEEPYVPPPSDGSGNDRRLLAEANRLFREAGWQLQDGRRVNEAGEQLTIEFLLPAPVFERIYTPFLQNLARLGVDATFRTVDPTQYQARLNAFDYDVAGMNLGASLTPGRNLRAIYHSDSANVPGNWNLAGISLPAVDALIEKVEQAETLEENYVIMSALDRVLRPHHFWIPQWYSGRIWIAHDASVKRPDTKPRYGLPIESHWWIDNA
ncbi:MAG: twin-arginine translocation signal domain-containing protein [Devosiaceae bacterium]|nr:twin-arginine translocation signal domain-containing protein [Devosiaceae bacterium MH13]